MTVFLSTDLTEPARHPGLDGLLLVDKPAGPTSHDVVKSVRRALGISRVGHAGTLDPFASGLLLIVAGRATRLARFLTKHDKAYEGTIRLGVATDTDDLTGTPLGPSVPPTCDEGRLAAAIRGLEGDVLQVPPAYAALKVRGVPLHRLARLGRPAEVSARSVRIHWENWHQPSHEIVRFRIRVSSGTYVRAIARDLGRNLGCGAHLQSLRRVASGPFVIGGALPYPPDPMVYLEALRPLEHIPLDLTDLRIPPGSSRAFLSGSAVTTPIAGDGPLSPGTWVRVLDAAGHLLGVGEIDVIDPERKVEQGDLDLGARLVRPRIVF